jgi:hypothetical protein
MATVNEKMTALANAIRSKSGATGKLSLDGMISAVNGISTGGGTTYQLWGSYSLFSDGEVDVSDLAGTYDCSSFQVATYFYDFYNSQVWVYDKINRIEVSTNGWITIYADSYDAYNEYLPDEGIWCDENQVFMGDPRLQLLEFPNPTTVSQSLYTLLSRMFDNGSYSGTAYDLGVSVGSSGGLEALGALCDWQFMIDSGSSPVLTIWNYHPSYYMFCYIEYNGFDVEVAIPCDDADSWDINGLMHDEYGDEYNASQFGAGATVNVYGIRWVQY